MLSISLFACAVSPVEQLDNQAREYGFVSLEIPGRGFLHRIYQNNLAQRGGVLHVYLEGDGYLLWSRGQYIPKDPTPRYPIMLHLMAMDTSPSIYLGRPCYHGFADKAPCHPQHWTYGRYSSLVVESMAQALRHYLASRQYSGLVFFGHSGGGTLAMLLAEVFVQTQDIITLAGNLDPEAWTDYHRYSALRTSLNPSQRAPLNSTIHQIHLAGEHDKEIPPQLIKAAVARQKGARIWVVPNFDHQCCWHELWPSILRAVACR